MNGRPDPNSPIPPAAQPTPVEPPAPQQQPQPEETSARDTILGVVDGVSDAVDIIGTVLSIWD